MPQHQHSVTIGRRNSVRASSKADIEIEKAGDFLADGARVQSRFGHEDLHAAGPEMAMCSQR